MFKISTIDRLCAALLLVLFAVTGYWAASRISRQKHHLQQQNALLSRRINAVTMAETNLKEIRGALNAVRAELAALNERIPSQAEMGGFIQEMDHLLLRRDIQLVRLTPMQPVNEKLYRRIPLQLSFKGRFSDVLKLVLDLESMNRLLVLNKLTITAKADETVCDVSLVADIFER